ncbi:ParB-like nuclease domain [Methylomonas albis]|nr:ParB-like nuclease domain [Methylomonas albis]
MNNNVTCVGSGIAQNYATYTYSNNGLPLTVKDAKNQLTTWPEASVFYITASYDALNRPTALLENGTVSLASYAYHDLSRRTTVTLGNGTTTGYGYDTQSALAGLNQYATAAGTGQDNTWSYTRNQVQDIKAASWTNNSYQWTG